MSPVRLVVWRYSIVAAVAMLGQCVAPTSQAVSPPPIDDRSLPAPAPARPPQPTVQREICAVPSMDRTARTGQLTGVDLQQVWRLTRGAGQRVAIIDTGVAAHSRLPRLAAGGDYVSTGDGMQDCDGHGTAVAGIVAATPDSSHGDDFSGVAPAAGLIAIRQSSTKFGTAADSAAAGVGDVNTMAQAVRTAADLGASVINISTIACTASEFDDRPLGAALSYAVDTKNTVVVAAAGNAGAGQCPPQHTDATGDSATTVVSPAWYDDYVLTVGSVNAAGEPSSFTLPGPWVDVAAPGEGVKSLSVSGDGLVNSLGGKQGSTTLSGTSYAAPVVSGLAALIRSRFPSWTARQVMQRIRATAHHPPGGWNSHVGAGVVDFLAAVSTDTAPTPAPATTPTSVPIVEPGIPVPPNHRARHTALTGAMVCAGSLAVVLSTRTLWARLRRATAERRNILSD